MPDTGKDVTANRDATSGLYRTGGPKKRPDFAIGGGPLNVKFNTKEIYDGQRSTPGIPEEERGQG